MNRKDLAEIKKRFNKQKCTFTKISGCMVNGEKNILLDFKESFLNLEEDDFFRYLDIAKKVLSGTVGNNLLELSFKLSENFESEKQSSLIELKKSKLNDDELLEELYQSIIDNYVYEENYLILVFHDVYDIIKKTSDNMKLDESEEVYEYIICAVCPVSLSDPGLTYFEEEKKIKSRIRDWVVEAPTIGFTYPAFIDRGPDVNSIIYYTKNAKNPHVEIMEETLGCSSKQTTTIQKQNFKDIIGSTIDIEDEDDQEVYMAIHENLNSMVEEHNEIHGDDPDAEPLPLTRADMQNILVESGIPEEATNLINTSFDEVFEEQPPIAEKLVDKNILEVSAIKKEEKQLRKKVLDLENKLGEIDELKTQYDIILQVNPDKVPQIKTEIIDGQKCIIIPVEDYEHTKINDLEEDILE